MNIIDRINASVFPTSPKIGGSPSGNPALNRYFAGLRVKAMIGEMKIGSLIGDAHQR